MKVAVMSLVLIVWTSPDQSLMPSSARVPPDKLRLVRDSSN